MRLTPRTYSTMDKQMTITHKYKSPKANVTDGFTICWSKKSKEGAILSVDVFISIHNVTGGMDEYRDRVNALIYDFNREYDDTEMPVLSLYNDLRDWYITAWGIMQKINEDEARKRINTSQE